MPSQDLVGTCKTSSVTLRGSQTAKAQMVLDTTKHRLSRGRGCVSGLALADVLSLPNAGMSLSRGGEMEFEKALW